MSTFIKNYYMKYSIVILILSISILKSTAQNKELKKPSSNASQIYFEAGGPGILYSVNYDGRFSKKENGLGGRIGIGIVSVDQSTFSSIPVGVNYLFGTEGKYFEAGLGMSFLSYKDNAVDLLDGSTTSGYLQLGYRSQPKKSGFTWRANFSPFFGFGYFVPFGGVSIGYRF